MCVGVSDMRAWCAPAAEESAPEALDASQAALTTTVAANQAFHSS